jgi:HK97 family phage portal protein
VGYFGNLMAAAFGRSEPVSQPDSWLIRAIGGGKTKAGVAVSEFTALNLPVVYACVNRIANPIARFPLKILRRTSDGGTEEVLDHPLSRRLGQKPNDWMSSRMLRKVVQGHALLWGNGYAEIERNYGGQAVNIWPLLPDRTRPEHSAGRLNYRIDSGGKLKTLDQGDVIHIMDQSFDGYVGRSPIWHARQALGLAHAAEEFGAKFFANDAKSGGFLMHPGKLGAAAKSNLGAPASKRTDEGAALERQGGLDNAHRVKVLEEGMKFISTTIPPDDAQFLSTREFQIAEIARIYDVPLVLLQSHEKSTSWGSGIEQLMIGFVRQTIDPWVDAWEQELNWKLFTEAEKARGYHVKFNMNAILRGDMASRAAFYKSLFGVGGLSPNQILALEDQEGIGPDGDHHFVPANFVTIEQAIKATAADARSAGSSGARADEETAGGNDEREDEQ